MDIDDRRVRKRVTFTTDLDEGEPAFLSNPNYVIYSRETADLASGEDFAAEQRIDTDLCGLLYHAH